MSKSVGSHLFGCRYQSTDGFPTLFFTLRNQSCSNHAGRELGYKEWLLESAAHYEEDDREIEARDSGDKVCDVDERVGDGEAAAAEEEESAEAPVPEVPRKYLMYRVGISISIYLGWVLGCVN